MHKRPADLQLQINVFRHFLIVRLEQLDCLLQRLKHFIGGSLSVFHGHHLAHHLHQTGIITFFDRLIKAVIRHLNKVVQVF